MRKLPRPRTIVSSPAHKSKRDPRRDPQKGDVLKKGGTTRWVLGVYVTERDWISKPISARTYVSFVAMNITDGQAAAICVVLLRPTLSAGLYVAPGDGCR